MKLNVPTWKEFYMASLFDSMYKGKAYSDEDLENIDGSIIVPYITRTDMNNGCKYMAKITENFHIEDGNAITIGDTTATCFYQKDKFITGDHIVILRADWLNLFRGLFVLGLLNQEKLKYSYGRAYKIDNIKKTLLKLPVRHHTDGTPVIDPEKKFSKDGYIPDWQFMENYIKSLHYKPLTTSRAHAPKKELDVSEWKDFVVGDIFNIQYGINMELNACEPCYIHDKEAVAFVARTAENNGVSAFVKKEQGMVPQAAGTITCAGGGSVLSTFVQAHDFYSGRDLYLLNTKENLSVKTKLFLTTVLLKNQYRYSYGRQANKTLPTLLLKLPIQHHSDGTPVIDPEKKYSKEGYIPDWQFMEDYINTLPYSDKIK